VILHMTVYLSRSTYLNVAETGASVPYDSCLLLYSFLPSFTPSFSCVTLDAGTVPWHQLKPARGNHVCVFITAVPITKLFAWGEGDSGGHVLRGACHTCVVEVVKSRNFLSSSNKLSSDSSLFLVPCSLSRITSLGTDSVHSCVRSSFYCSYRNKI